MSEKLKIQIHSVSDIGKVRTHNEDRWCIVPTLEQNGLASVFIEKGKGLLCAVADGMGGTNAGEIAAGIAIQTVVDSATNIDTIILRPADIGKSLEKIIYKAHLNIINASNADNAGMGTTLILALFYESKVYIAWCGDSRAYKYNAGAIEPKNKFDLPHLQILTNDHSIVWQMVRKGKLDPNEARTHELSNVITQSLGDSGKDPRPESIICDILPGDKIMLCSDGLNSMLPDEYIQEILAHDEPVKALTQSLLEAANSAGGLDNTTIILAQIESIPEKPIQSYKQNPHRPEAITSKSDLLASKNTGRGVTKMDVMKNPVLIIILVAGILSMLYFINSSTTDKSRSKALEGDNPQIIMSVPTDTSQAIPVNDTLKEKLNDGEKNVIDTTKNIE